MVDAEQSRGVGPAHMPLLQASPTVQNWPSSQVPPWLAACASQALDVSLHTPVVQTPFSDEQSRGVVPAHMPLLQESPPAC